MSAKQGYSASFLYEVPEDLTCVICSLVLRDPIQVIDCGHRFCSPCFNNMLEYSKDQLLCPIDRQPVERDRVFADKGMTRMINNLKVKCKNDEQGCEWRGHLGDLDTHESSCQFQVVAPPTDQYDALNDLCKQLVQRVQRCEEKSDMKEKELAHLRFTIKELKGNINCDEELKILKDEVTYLKLTIKDLRDEAYKGKELTITLTDSTSELKNKVEMLKKEKEEIAQKCKNELKQLEEKNDYLEKEMENVKQDICDRDSIKAANAEAKQQFSSLNEKLKNNETSQVKVIGDIKNLTSQLDNIQKEVRSARGHLDKSLNKSKNKITENTTGLEKQDKRDICDKITEVKQTVTDQQLSLLADQQQLSVLADQQLSFLNEKLKNNEISQEKLIGGVENLTSRLDNQLNNVQKEVRSTRSHFDKSISKIKNETTENTTEIKNLKDVKSEVRELQNHVMCIENILFLLDSAETKEVEFKWIMTDFQEKRRIGEAVVSPVFYTQVDGYSFQIMIDFTEPLEVSLRLHRGKSEKGTNLDLLQFSHDLTLEVLDRSGGSTKTRVINSKQEKFIIEHFLTIHPGKDQAKGWLGFPNIKSPCYNYVINDSLYTKCTLHL